MIHQGEGRPIAHAKMQRVHLSALEAALLGRHNVGGTLVEGVSDLCKLVILMHAAAQKVSAAKSSRSSACIMAAKTRPTTTPLRISHKRIERITKK